MLTLQLKSYDWRLSGEKLPDRGLVTAVRLGIGYVLKMRKSALDINAGLKLNDRYLPRREGNRMAPVAPTDRRRGLRL